MKKFLIGLIVVFSMMACGVASKPSWATIGKDGVYVTVQHDTLYKYQLDSLMEADGLDYTSWPKMSHYNSRRDSLVQWTCVSNDTLYSVSTYYIKYIYDVRVLKRDEE